MARTWIQSSKILLVFLAVATLFSTSIPASSSEDRPQAGYFLDPTHPFTLSIDQESFERKILADLSRVREFQWLSNYSREKGVRIFLFGGAAATFAHYSRWAQAAQEGTENLRRDRLDFNFMNIFHPLQDVDIVLDGTPEQAAVLEKELLERFPYYSDTKSAWEIRLLRRDYHDKLRILDNPDFLNQHNDSMSIGLIELSTPPKNAPAITDLRSWPKKSATFLPDVYEGMIHFLHSEEHKNTYRYLKNLNPEIFATLRLISKAGQLDLKISPEDFQTIRSLNLAFEKTPQWFAGYAERWLQFQVKKLIFATSDLERTAELLKESGLREILARLEPDLGKDTVSWWITREPLPKFEIGTGDGPTAAELGISTVTHNAGSLEAYFAITSSIFGHPNFFRSRLGVPGEAAVYGEGVYAAIGSTGDGGSQVLPIPLIVRPEARLGTDFEIVGPKAERHLTPQEGDWILFLNSSAISIPETHTSFDLYHYLEFGNLEPGAHFAHNGLEFRFRELAKVEVRNFSPAQEDALLHHVLADLIAAKKTKQWRVPAAVQKYLDIHPDPLSSQELYVALLDYADAGQNLNTFSQIARAAARCDWKRFKHCAKIFDFFDEQELQHLIPLLFGKGSTWNVHPSSAKILLRAITRADAKTKRSDTFLANLIDAIDSPEWLENPGFTKVFSAILKLNSERMSSYLLKSNTWAKNPTFRTALKRELREELPFEGGYNALFTPLWWDDPEWPAWVDQLIVDLEPSRLTPLMEALRSQRWAGSPEALRWLKKLQKGPMGLSFMESLLSARTWADQPESRNLLRELWTKESAKSSIFQVFLGNPAWQVQPDYYLLASEFIKKTPLEALPIAPLDEAWQLTPGPLARDFQDLFAGKKVPNAKSLTALIQEFSTKLRKAQCDENLLKRR